MAVILTGTGGLFTRLGKIGNLINIINTFRGTTILADIDELQDNYDNNRDLVSSIESEEEGLKSGMGGILDTLKDVAKDTVIYMVTNDNPQEDSRLSTALVELISQMDTSNDSIDANTVSSSTTTGSSNYGDGKLVVSLKDDKGVNLEMVYDEDIVIECTSDSQSGAASQSFTFLGEASESDKLSYNWPRGSGCRKVISTVSAAVDAGKNLLTNSGFETWTEVDEPDNWTILSGTPTTDIFEEATTVYAGESALKFSTGSPKISQTFGVSTGTIATLSPYTTYSVCFWARVNTAAASGSITVRLYDASGLAVLADAASTSNTTTVNLTSLTTSYVAYTVVFRTPRIIPTVRLEIFATSIPASRSVYIDHVSMVEMSDLYAGGPKIALHAGALDFMREDNFTLIPTNNYAGDFVLLLEKLFDLNSLGLVFPTNSSSTETIGDNLVS